MTQVVIFSTVLIYCKAVQNYFYVVEFFCKWDTCLHVNNKFWAVMFICYFVN